MRLSNPIENLAASVHHAAWVAFPDRVYEMRDFGAEAKREDKLRAQGKPVPRRGSPDFVELSRRVVRRPDPTECHVFSMFSQNWGSTALGFGGLGGAAMTDAYTVVVEGPDGSFAVYWAGQFAYLVPKNVPSAAREAFLADVSKRKTISRRNATERYGATWPTSVEEDDEGEDGDED